MSEVSVILVNYRQPALTEAAVASLRKSGEFAAMDVVVVDNGSGDGSLERLRASCADCTVLDAGGNLGFSGGNNVGIRHALAAGAEWILLLNNDAEAEPGLLGRLVAAAGGGRFLAAPKIVYASAPSRVWYGGGYVDRVRGGFYHDTDPELASRPREVGFASGCCMLLPAEFFRTEGLMDESYFLYYEDAELCMRAARAGWRIRYVPDAVVRHKVGVTTGGACSRTSVYYGTRNRLAVLTGFGFPFYAKAFVLLTRLMKLALVPIRPALMVSVAGVLDWMSGRMGRKEGL